MAHSPDALDGWWWPLSVDLRVHNVWRPLSLYRQDDVVGDSPCHVNAQVPSCCPDVSSQHEVSHFKKPGIWIRLRDRTEVDPISWTIKGRC